MSESYIKVNMWMASADLSPAEILIFAVIHSYTMTGKDYHGGIQGLKSWTGCSERTIQRSLARLVSEEWIIAKAVSSGRNASVYVSNPVKMAGMNPVNLTPQPRQNDTVNPVNLTPNNNINNTMYKNTPLTPLRGGTDGKPSTRRRSRNPALNYKDATDYSREALRKKGISFGEEFYDDN